MSETPHHVLVIGAGLGGLRTVEALRSGGFTGHLTLVGAEPDLPYDRPPLSKQILAGAWEPERISLTDRAELDKLQVDLRLGQPVVELRDRRAILADGERLDADAIVIATGADARTLPGQTDRFATLRTLTDALDLKGRIAEADSLLVLGSGFIGTEIASGAVAQGKHVTVIEAAAHPFARSLGPVIGAVAARLLAESGVTLLCGSPVSEFVDRGRAAVLLADGTVVEADLGVVGVGSTVDLGWIHDDRIVVDDGVRCDDHGRAVGAEGIWSVGDAANWAVPGPHAHVRSEHWTATQEQARVVAADILGSEPPTPSVPYVWSDQFGMKIQVLGSTTPDDEVVALHGNGEVRGTVFGHFDGDAFTAVTGFGAPALTARYRAPLTAGYDRGQVTQFAAGLDAPKPVAAAT